MAQPDGMGWPTMTKPAELYACAYAKEFPAQALLRLRLELRDKPCVVMEGEPPLQSVCSCNAKARKLGAVQGMTPVEIDTLPSVVVLARSRAEEETAKAALLECAGTFSPRVEDRSNDYAFVCVVDIAGTETLFGSSASLAKRLLERIRALGVIASVAVSDNFHTALCVAQARSSRMDVTVIASGNASKELSSLPLSVLNISEEHTETFSLWSVHTLGMLAELPEPALISRIGQLGKRLRQLACGEMPHLFLPVEPVFVLEERMELDTPVELLESLLFYVNAMLEQLIVRATTRVFALASVTTTLSLEGETTHTRIVRPALPTNDRKLWIKLLQLDLEAHPPPAAILSLTITAEPGSTSKVQLGLFSPQLPEAARLDVTLGRIRAIVGEDCVGRAVLKDTHQVEGFRMEPFTVPVASVSETEPASQRAAMRQLRPAESIIVMLREKRPESFFFRQKKYVAEHAYGPWLTSGDWWNPTLWSLQQWDLIAHSESGELLSCCLTHDLTQGGWQMVGLYD